PTAHPAPSTDAPAIPYTPLFRSADLHVNAGSLSATNGTATLDVDGRTIHFTPDLDKNDGNVGLAGFTVTYKANDGSLDSNTATLTISVSAVNDAPGADDHTSYLHEHTAIARHLLPDDTDVDNANADLHANAG